MATEIKAIETVYNGYRFRSRLEARWAVFFDSAGIEYQYEPEGFVLSNGECYLPDFYLPQFHMYAEIKPFGINATDKYIAMGKLQLLFNSNNFSEEGNGIVVALLIGDPYENNKWIYCNYSDNDGGGSSWFKFDFVRGAYGEYNDKKYCFEKNVKVIIVSGGMDDFIFDSSGYDGNARLINDTEIHGFLSNFKRAKLKARQARFEHGECG